MSDNTFKELFNSINNISNLKEINVAANEINAQTSTIIRDEIQANYPNLNVVF